MWCFGLRLWQGVEWDKGHAVVRYERTLGTLVCEKWISVTPVEENGDVVLRGVRGKVIEKDGRPNSC